MCVTNYNQLFTYTRDFKDFTVRVDYTVTIQPKLSIESLFTIQGYEAQCVIDNNNGNLSTDNKFLIKYQVCDFVETSRNASDYGLLLQFGQDNITEKYKEDIFYDTSKECEDNDISKITKIDSSFNIEENIHRKNVQKSWCSDRISKQSEDARLEPAYDKVFVMTETSNRIDKVRKLLSHKESVCLKFPQNKTDETTKNPTEIVECEFCNESIQPGKILQEHTDKQDKIYLCSNCNTSFQTKCQLNQHKLLCIICKYCKKHFKSTKEINEHNNVNYQPEYVIDEINIENYNQLTEYNQLQDSITEINTYNGEENYNLKNFQNIICESNINSCEKQCMIIQKNFKDRQNVDQYDNYDPLVNTCKKGQTNNQNYLENDKFLYDNMEICDQSYLVNKYIQDQFRNCNSENRNTNFENYQHNLRNIDRKNSLDNCETEVTSSSRDNDYISGNIREDWGMNNSELPSATNTNTVSNYSLQDTVGQVNNYEKKITDDKENNFDYNQENIIPENNHTRSPATKNITSNYNHLSKNAFACNLCQHKFTTKCLVQLHKNLKHFEHKICDYCKSTYSDQDADFHSKNDLLTCEKCGSIYLTNCLLKLHLYYCYKCNTCKKLFKNEISFKKHSTCIASKPDENITDCRVTPDNNPVISSCDDSYKYVKNFQHHPKQLPCEICNKVFDNHGKFKQHVKNHLTDKKIMCAECGKTFKLPNQLKIHLTTHSSTRAYQCELCDKSFKTKSTLIMHRKSHAGIKPFQCDICNKHFTRKSALKLHLQQHSSIKPFTCNVCEKQFYRKHHLTLHLEKHTGKPSVASNVKREFQCEICGKAFSTKTTLLVHVRIHTGEKPYVCVECGKQFSQRNGLDYHKRTHSGVKPFKCELCGKGFGLKWQLIEHERVHTGEKPFKCKVCDLGFSVRSNFYRHSKLHNE